MTTRIFSTLGKSNVLLPGVDVVLELEHETLVDANDVTGVGCGIVAMEGTRQTDAVCFDIDEVGKVAFEVCISKEVVLVGASSKKATFKGLSLCCDGTELLFGEDVVSSSSCSCGTERSN